MIENFIPMGNQPDRLPHAEVVVIIGNGFDIDLGLETSYKKFLCSDCFSRYITSDDLMLFSQLREAGDSRNWIDLENELKVYAKFIDETFSEYELGDRLQIIDRYKKDFSKLVTGIQEFLSEQERVWEISDLNYQNTKAFEFMKRLSKNGHKCLIFDFNFTSTTEKILREIGWADQLINQRLRKVHGSLKLGNVVVGIEDFNDSNYHDNYYFLFKSRSHTGINISSAMDHANEINIFGHSLGITDTSYFTEYFNSKVNSYFTMKSQDDIMQSFSIYDCNYDSMAKINGQILRMTSGKSAMFKQNVFYKEYLNCD